MRICFVNVNPESDSGAFVNVLEKVIYPIKDRETEIGFKFPKIGCNRATDFATSYFLVLNKIYVIEAIIEAEKEGYDAVVVGCFLDPGVKEARELVNIPVIGINEFTLSLAAQMGKKCAIVGLHDEKLNLQTEQVIQSRGYRYNYVMDSIIPIDMPDVEWMKNGIQNPQMVADSVEKAARKGISNGADVVVVGCAGLGSLTALACLKEIQGTDVPVLDPVTVGIKAAEFWVRLTKSLGLPPVSRARKYKMPRSKDVDRIKQIFGL